VCIDNGAYTAWKQEKPVPNWDKYQTWLLDLYRHPAFDFAFIPDVIGGSEEDNDALLGEWNQSVLGVPVYHMHESLERAERLVHEWPIVAIGSSGQWPTPGAKKWKKRMSEIMGAMTDDQGRPHAKLHGLRMLNPELFSRMPLSSADSTNAVRNSCSLSRFGTYTPATSGQRSNVIADRIEAYQSAPVWTGDSAWGWSEDVQFQLLEDEGV